VQAYSQWTSPEGTLGTIVREAHARAAELEGRHAELEQIAANATVGPSFADALRREAVGLIAEVKRRSPSRGDIAPRLDALAQATEYLRGGAVALSVLTEPAHFGGSPQDVLDVRRSVPLPILKKDFHVAPIQLLEARALGASAALLIVRALSPEVLPAMMQAGGELGLDLLVEVRDEAELARALDAGATIIGVNNRNLESLVIDPSTAERLIPQIPSGVIAVAESGIVSRPDVERYAAVGADAVLVGSSLSGAVDVAQATRALTGVTRRERGR